MRLAGRRRITGRPYEPWRNQGANVMNTANLKKVLEQIVQRLEERNLKNRRAL